MDRVQLEQRALNLDTRVFMTMSSGPNDPMLSLDLTMPQLKVLLLVDRQGEPSMSELSQTLRVGQSAISGLVDRLSEHGLIRREEDVLDRRVVRVRCEPKGQKLVQKIRLAGRDRMKLVFARLSDDELLRVVEAMELMYRAVVEEIADQNPLTTLVTAHRSSV